MRNTWDFFCVVRQVGDSFRVDDFIMAHAFRFYDRVSQRTYMNFATFPNKMAHLF
jgi:hypothetical protein